MAGILMRTTVCELPHETDELHAAWDALCKHAIGEHSALVVLPEFAFAPPVWQIERLDAAIWLEAEAQCDRWLSRLPELGAEHVIGTRPRTVDGKPFNEGFLWSRSSGLRSLRSKHFLPDEPGGWEARWFTRGDEEFPGYSLGPLSFGLNICSELWALETYGRYTALGVQAVIAPRATAAATTNKWLAAGTVAAVRSGAFCLSSNRVHPDGSCGGVGWIISPDGELLARTSMEEPFCTLDVDFAASITARKTYPRYLFDD